ncbi:MAG: hypothetical protein JRM75_04640, partial [Nitrososphaerota archaeon]|nr:hypothetical protein [Nitrososphaerota archaeon]
MLDHPLVPGPTSAVEVGPWHYGADYIAVYFRGERAALAGLVALAGVGQAQAADITISGSTMLFPLEQVWSQAYMKSHPGTHIS